MVHWSWRDCIIHPGILLQLQRFLPPPGHLHGGLLSHDPIPYLFTSSGDAKTRKCGIGIRSYFHLFKHRTVCCPLFCWKDQRLNRFLQLDLPPDLPLLPPHRSIHLLHPPPSPLTPSLSPWRLCHKGGNGKNVMLNLFQHLIKSIGYETLKRVQGDKITITTQSLGGEGEGEGNSSSE